MEARSLSRGVDVPGRLAAAGAASAASAASGACGGGTRPDDWNKEAKECRRELVIFDDRDFRDINGLEARLTFHRAIDANGRLRTP
jgi:hypothetical protein